MKLYDIVLTCDGSFDLPLEIINCVVKSDRMKHNGVLWEDLQCI